MKTSVFPRYGQALAPVLLIAASVVLPAARAQQPAPAPHEEMMASMKGDGAMAGMDHADMMGMAMQAPAAGADWAKAKLDASPRHKEFITVKYGTRTVKAFVVYPDGKKKASVVLVVHEATGLTDWARGMADDLAAKGYIGVAADLLSGFGPNGGDFDSFPDRDSRIKAIMALDPKVVLTDLDAVADAALKLPQSDGKLAVAGFCWGGDKGFDFATQRKDLKAALVFYAKPPDAAAIPNITAPVYAFYGAKDARVDATIPTATDEMKAAGKKFEPVTYDGAGHGYMSAGEDPNAVPDLQKAFADSMVRMEDILKAM